MDSWWEIMNFDLHFMTLGLLILVNSWIVRIEYFGDLPLIGGEREVKIWVEGGLGDVDHRKNRQMVYQ